MKIIYENEMNLEAIQAAFKSVSLTASIIENYPAAPEMNLDRDAYLEINYPNGHHVIIWLDTHAKMQLRFRAIAINREDLKNHQRKNVISLAISLNNQISCFGTIAPESIGGTTIEYRLPYSIGLLDTTIISISKQISEGAERFVKII